MERKNIILQCKKCKGSGFQKKKIIYTCEHCGSKYNCMYCENVAFKGLYEECTMCVGRGEIFPSTPAPNKEPDTSHSN